MTVLFNSGEDAPRMISAAFLFPGQGSQAVGMGKEVHSQHALAREVFQEADDVLQTPLTRLCFEGPIEELTLTENTQPALLTVAWATARVVEQELDLHPTWAAGHSLGEFSALVAAGALRFGDAVRVVRERGRAMQQAVPPGVGSMAAILGLELDVVASVCREAAGDQIVSSANLNGAGQIVVAGHREAVDRAIEIARSRGAKKAIPLAVSAPFHCALMQPAAERLRSVLQDIDVRPFRCPVISNVEAKPNSDPSRVKDLLVRQVTSPVRWQESIEELARAGCTVALELGPGKVLTALAKRIAPQIRCAAVENAEQARALLGAS